MAFEVAEETETEDGYAVTMLLHLPATGVDATLCSRSRSLSGQMRRASALVNPYAATRSDDIQGGVRR